LQKPCAYTYNVKEWATITGAVDCAVVIYRQRGELTEAEMDALEIPSVKKAQVDKRPKDERMLHQQRAVIMNSADCIAKYENHYATKALAVVERVAARERREIAQGKAKENREQKRVEKENFDNLSPAEKTAVRRAKRIANAAAKAAALLAAGLELPTAADDDDDDDDLDIFADEEIYNR
jgi:hypothetical protein